MLAASRGRAIVRSRLRLKQPEKGIKNKPHEGECSMCMIMYMYVHVDTI